MTQMETNYLKAMRYVGTCRFRGRLHECPICHRLVWSTFGQARKHWEMHLEGREARCNACHVVLPGYSRDNVRELRRHGWTVSRTEGNICYDCAGEMGLRE